jgi:hypothetical protein
MAFTDSFEENYAALGHRVGTMKKVLEYLDGVENPRIVETGTTRKPLSIGLQSDGCATLIFQEYLKSRFTEKELKERNLPALTSIDCDANACRIANMLTEDWVDIAWSDSVAYLDKLEGKVDLLFLDSMDFDIFRFEENKYDNRSAEHHLKELLAAQHLIKKGTLIVVDDCSEDWNYGKGQLVKEYFEALGVEPLFTDYQIGWIWAKGE